MSLVSSELVIPDFSVDQTVLPDNFHRQVAEYGAAWPYFPVSNDRGLASAYLYATEKAPEADDDKTGVCLVVGNGAIDAAMSLLPESMPILHIDINARTLFIQRVFRQLVENADNLSDFKKALYQFDDDIRDHDAQYPESRRAGTLAPRLHDQHAEWNARVTPHFLEDAAAFRTMKAKLATHPIAYRILDIGSIVEINQLSADLEASQAQITIANVTNVFDKQYSEPHHAGKVAARLPFHENAMVISSRNYSGFSGLQASARPMSSWLNLQGIRDRL